MTFHYFFKVEQDGRDQFWSWKLLDDNGGTFATGPHYQTKDACLKGIEDYKAASVNIKSANVVQDGVGAGDSVQASE